LAARVLECECGYVARGDDDAQLVADVQSHARQCHDMDVPPELILRMARPAAEQSRVEVVDDGPDSGV
jgi:predicted small metal-binding protein